MNKRIREHFENGDSKTGVGNNLERELNNILELKND
jgi:hypothetical protein